MRSFSQMIANVTASENATYDAILETVGYITQQYHAKRTKDGAGNEYWPQLISAIRTKWIADKVCKLKPAGKVLGAMDIETACMMVAPKLSEVFHAQKTKNAAARAKRQQATMQAPQATNTTQGIATHSHADENAIEGECAHCDDNVLIVGGVAVDLSEEEASALQVILSQMRMRDFIADKMPQLKVA